MTGPPSISAALADSIYRSAVLMQREGRYAEAEAEYVRLLPYFPDSAALHYNIGLLLYAQDRFEASLEHYLQAMDEAGDDPDLLYNLSRLVSEMGCEVVAAVAPARANILESVLADKVGIGDLEDMETAAQKHGAQLVISNSHAAESARRLGVPLLRAGFPQYDLIGGYQRLWIGYRGTRQTLFDLANILVGNGHHEIPAYRSVYHAACHSPGEANHASPAPGHTH